MTAKHNMRAIFDVAQLLRKLLESIHPGAIMCDRLEQCKQGARRRGSVCLNDMGAEAIE